MMNDELANIWYMAAWSEEIGETPFSRRLNGRPVLLVRKADGSVVALEDRCPHRFAPLSLGQWDGETVSCGYHGLAFDSQGRCVRNPFSDKIPTGAVVRGYPVVERDGIVWYWPGDPARADEADIASLPFLDATPANHVMRGYTAMAANFEYGTDNLMDLSHIEFVHRGSFAGAGVIFAGTHDVTQDGNTLHSNWWMPDVAAPGHTFGIYPRDLRTDHWLDMRWNAPATMYLQIGATPVGEAREKGVVVEQAHILTPESADRTHYFWISTSAMPLDDPAVATQMRALFAQAFDDEDKPMIEAAYRNVTGDFWDEKPVFLGIDSGGTRARRLLETMRRAERAG